MLSSNVVFSLLDGVHLTHGLIFTRREGFGLAAAALIN